VFLRNVSICLQVDTALQPRGPTWIYRGAEVSRKNLKTTLQLENSMDRRSETRVLRRQLGSFGSASGPMAGTCEHGNEQQSAYQEHLYSPPSQTTAEENLFVMKHQGTGPVFRSKHVYT
jgi:hypothetical protein